MAIYKTERSERKSRLREKVLVMPSICVESEDYE